MSLRILLVADFYPPFLGGVELQTKLLGEELAARGHSVTVATVWHDGLADRELVGGVDVRRIRAATTRARSAYSDPSRRRYHPPAPDPGSTVGLRRLIAETRPDVVNASGWLAYSVRLALAGSGLPLVLSTRDFGYECPTRTLVLDGAICSGPEPGKCLRHAARVYGDAKGIASTLPVLGLRRWLVGYPTAVHVNSRFVADIARRDLLPPRLHGRIALVPDMIALREPAPPADGPDVLARLPREPFILFVGALQRHKGIEPLLAAYAGLEPRPPLVMVGTRWPDTPETWPNGVTVFTDVPNGTVVQIWRRALFGVAPSLVPETFGGVVTEAMRARRAVIASAIGGPLDTVDDRVSGFLVQPGDVPQLATAMQALVDDPGLRERMGEAGRRRVESMFATDVVVPQFEALFERVAGRPT